MVDALNYGIPLSFYWMLQADGIKIASVNAIIL